MTGISAAAAPSAAGVAAALPEVWRASELGAYRAATVSTGHAGLDRELPGGGWPTA